MSRVAVLWDEADEDAFGDPLGTTAGTSAIGPVAFPSSPLTFRVYIAPGADLTASYLSWPWADITNYVRHDLGVGYTVGRRDESTRVTASSATLKLDNRDGRFSRKNPLGPYFGGLTKNTPIWISINPGSGFVDRYFGYVNEWPNRWTDPSGTDSYVTIRCGGVMRRLSQGETLETSLNRTILGDSPLYFWRLDDPAGSTTAASALGGGLPITQVDSVTWGSLDPAPGAGSNQAPLLGVGGSVGNFVIDDAVVAAIPVPWAVEFSVLRPSAAPTFGIATIHWTNVGTSTDGVSIQVAQDTDSTARDWYHYLAVGIQDGPTARVRLWRNGLERTGFSETGTLGPFKNLWLSRDPTLSLSYDVSLTHVALYGTSDVDPVSHSGALQAFNGEQAHVRVARLCAEAGIQVAVNYAVDSALMGEQGPGNLLDLLRECEETDQGVLYEYQFGLAYQSVSARYNQPVTLALDFDQGHIAGTPEPADDDQRLRNQWTITRADSGTTRTARDQASVTASGLYDDSKTVSLSSDAAILQNAGWRVRIGTVDEDRWPRMPFQLHRPTNASLIPTWLSTPLGSRITIAHPPSGSDPGAMAPDLIDQILEGYSEAFDQVAWGVSLNLAPFSPYIVGVAGGGGFTGALTQTSGSTITTAISTTDTSLIVATPSGSLWTTTPVGLTVEFGGETATVSAISGASSPQTFTVARSLNGVVKAHAAGTVIKVYRAARAAL